MRIVTGYTGQAHITSNDDQGRNLGILGNGRLVLIVGGEMAASIGSANAVTIADGEAVMKGVHFRIEPGSAETVNVPSAASGKYRKDLIVARYTKNQSTGVESVQLMDLQGEEASSIGLASYPAYANDDIRTGGTTCDMILLYVTVSSAGIVSSAASGSGANGEYQTVASMVELQGTIDNNQGLIQWLYSLMALSEYALTSNNPTGIATNSETAYYFTSGYWGLVNFNIDGQILASGWQLLYTLPGRYKPKRSVIKTCIRRDGLKYAVEARTNGNIYITNLEGTLPADSSLMRDQIIFPLTEV